jgi:hypothetical protein
MHITHANATPFQAMTVTSPYYPGRLITLDPDELGAAIAMG